MIEIISIKAKYFISASLAVVLTTLSLYYAFQWQQGTEWEKSILERMWGLEERMRCSEERTRYSEERIWNINKRIQCIEGEYNQSTYNQKGCSQEQTYGHEPSNLEQSHDYKANNPEHEISASQEDKSSYQDKNEDSYQDSTESNHCLEQDSKCSG